MAKFLNSELALSKKGAFLETKVGGMKAFKGFKCRVASLAFAAP